jgi:ATP-binding cassette subfamily B protein
LLEIALVVGIFIFKFNGWFTLTIFTAIAAYIGFSVVVTEWRMRYVRRLNELDSGANTRAIDSLLNYETVKYFTNESFETERYDESLAAWETASVKNQVSLSTLNIGQAGIIAAGVTAMMILAAREVVQGHMTIGDLVMVNAYMLQLFTPLNFLGFVYRQIKRSLADMERMFALLERHAAVADEPGAPALHRARGALRFEGVQFGYQPEREILHGVSFAIPAGKKLAVVGPSGAGKSTLARLLFRFYDVDEVRILIDGKNIRHVTQASLRRTIGIVPQDTVLFNASIYYNIAYGNPEADRAAVLRAAELAQLRAFIEALPAGYDTEVGERGLKLSGGEKQRVAIARTLLKDPPILVLDEATSSLDSHAEQAILAALDRIAAERTTLAIAHRLSTVADADEIVVLDGGRIVERGDHVSLLGRGGLYARLWELQRSEARRAPIMAAGRENRRARREAG